MFHERIASGVLDGTTVRFAPGVTLHSDPALGLSGRWRSPAGRFLELEATMSGKGVWIALHVALPLSDLTDATHVGLVCRCAAPERHMLRPCLRSGLDDGSGFVDCFFDKHVLTAQRPRSHVDALYLDAATGVPLRAPWRELVLFLPRVSFHLDLHQLYPFVL